jgi:hypothetical protein
VSNSLRRISILLFRMSDAPFCAYAAKTATAAPGEGEWLEKQTPGSAGDPPCIAPKANARLAGDPPCVATKANARIG